MQARIIRAETALKRRMAARGRPEQIDQAEARETVEQVEVALAVVAGLWAGERGVQTRVQAYVSSRNEARSSSLRFIMHLSVAGPGVPRQLGFGLVEAEYRALRDEIFRRLDKAREDPNVKNADGSNYWGPRVTKAVKDRENDGPALVKYVKGVLRKMGESEGWNALMEGHRLNLTFEDMVLRYEPIRGLFTDEDRRLAAELLDEQESEIERKRDEREAEEAAREAEAVEHDHEIVDTVRRSREAAGKPWSPEIEAEMLRGLAERRRKERQR
jgi:hypothetical protein